MTKNEEDLLFSIYEEIERDNLRKKFNKQLKNGAAGKTQP